MMLEITKTFSDEVEYYAVDEFFFGWDVKDEAEAQQLATNLQATILQQTQLPVTVGIARTKTLAKLLSDQSKPFGVATMLTSPAEEAFLAKRPITDVCGIANRRAKRLAPYSVKSVLDLCKMRVHTVRKVLTIVGERLWYELHGERSVPSKRNVL
jgi:DNA polymerase V